MSTRDIHDKIKYLYDIKISAKHASQINNHIFEHDKAWQNRYLECVYIFVFMDAIYYKINPLLYRIEIKLKHRLIYTLSLCIN